MAVADGNNTDSSTWALIDSTSYLESESITVPVPTSYGTGFTAFTPGAITIDGIALRLLNRAGTSGTFSVELYNNTAGASVAGTEVTINCSDFNDAVQASLDGGWYFFKFSSAVTLSAATAYFVRFKTSVSSQISLVGASTALPSRMLRTTTTQAPVAGDDRYVMGEWTAAGTTTTRTVTLNDTTTVDYGAASTSQVTPALSISAGGIVIAGTSASTTYVQKISGNVVVYNGGILRIATSGSPMPTTSSFTWTFDCGANVDFGIDVRRNGEFTAYGASKTRWTLLTSDEAAASTSIQVADTTGWANSDVLVFAGTGTTTTHGETKTVSTVDSATQVTLSAGLTNAHTGTGDVVGEVGNLTCNVRIVGASASLCTFICFRASSLGVLDNVGVQYFGSATTNKRGVECQHINTSSNSCTFNSCAFRDYFNNASSFVGNVQSAGNLYYITNCVMTSGTAGTGIQAVGGTAGTPTFDVSGNLVTGQGTALTTGLNMALITGAGGTCTNNRIAGCTSGLSYSPTHTIGTTSNISGFKVHSCTSGIVNGTTQTKTMTSCDVVCNANGLIQPGGVITIESCNFYGNSTAGVNMSSGGIGNAAAMFNNCVFRGRTSFNQPIGVNFTGTGSATGEVAFNSCSFGATIAHTTSDIGTANIIISKTAFNNCTFASTTEITATAYAKIEEGGYIGIQRKDTTAGNHVAYIRQGIITRDTTIYNTASPSLRIAPKSATVTASTRVKPFAVPVNNGQTCTPSVYVRESESGDGAAYNGNRVKLYVKANYNLGITSDTLLDTATAASDGAWEQLTGTTDAVTDDGVLEFYLVCDGTAGWINVDDFTATVS